MAKIKDLISKLDEEVKEVVPDVYRYELKHAVAEDVAETLNEVVEASTGRSFQRRAAAGARSQQTGALGAGFAEEEIIIVPEPHTNSLLIRASGTQYQWIRQLLDDIDKRLPQVLIEAAVVELTGSFSDAFGVELGYLDLADDPNANITRGFGFTGFGLTEFIDQDGDGIPELRLPSLEGLASGGLTGGIFQFPGFQVPFILQAISTDSESNLLSLPSVITNDNGSATILVGSEQATTSSSLAGSGVSQGGFSGYEEANLTLSISPHISSDDYLRLDIELDVVSFTGSERIISGQVIPAPRTRRNVTASVTVPNESTVILGGLIQNQTTDDRTKVPFFGDLPLVGWLFRSTQATEDRRTLYLFVTPHILKEEDFTDLYDLTHIKEMEVHALIGDEIKLFDPDFTPKRVRGGKGAVSPELEEYLRDLDIPRYRSPSEMKETPEGAGTPPTEPEPGITNEPAGTGVTEDGAAVEGEPAEEAVPAEEEAPKEDVPEAPGDGSGEDRIGS
jgi:general secretion pathway protein D